MNDLLQFLKDGSGIVKEDCLQNNKKFYNLQINSYINKKDN